MECKLTNIERTSQTNVIKIYPEWNVNHLPTSLDNSQSIIKIYPEWNVNAPEDLISETQTVN